MEGVIERPVFSIAYEFGLSLENPPTKAAILPLEKLVPAGCKFPLGRCDEGVSQAAESNL